MWPLIKFNFVSWQYNNECIQMRLADQHTQASLQLKMKVVNRCEKGSKRKVFSLEINFNVFVSRNYWGEFLSCMYGSTWSKSLQLPN